MSSSVSELDRPSWLQVPVYSDLRAFYRSVYYDGLLVGTLLFEDVVVLEDDRADLDHWVHGFEQDFHALTV